MQWDSVLRCVAETSSRYLWLIKEMKTSLCYIPIYGTKCFTDILILRNTYVYIQRIKCTRWCALNSVLILNFISFKEKPFPLVRHATMDFLEVVIFVPTTHNCNSNKCFLLTAIKNDAISQSEHLSNIQRDRDESKD